MERRNQSLDLLRGIAILLVIAHHYIPPQRESILHVGGMGVDLFFVLSGYLICNLLFSEIKATGSVQIGRFLIRRSLKIYPAFYVFLILTLPLVHSENRAKLLPEFFFLQQYVPHIWQHTWSLSVEETF
jgi:peptidoglycan/LPS O-acetylase OafA/YrhL